MKYEVQRSGRVWFTVIGGLAIFAFCIWGINYSLTADLFTLKIMLLIPAYIFLGVFVYLLIGIINMSYSLNDKGLTIYWVMSKIVVPWSEVVQLIKVEGRGNVCTIIGANWPGYKVGMFNAKGLGPIRMYATTPEQGFIYLKTKVGFFGLTPAKDNFDKMLQYIAMHSEKEIEYVHLDEIPEEIRGESMHEDSTFKLLFNINIVMLVLYALYLLFFFPGSGAPRFVILLLVLAVALFFFNTGNAQRLYQFTGGGGYAMLALGIIVTGIFLILSLGEISL